MIVVIDKNTGLIRLSDNSSDAETMLKNAINAELVEADIEVKEITCEEYESLRNAEPKPQPTPLEQLKATDAGMARVAEDIVSILLAKGVLQEIDLPKATLDKITIRQDLRRQLTA